MSTDVREFVAEDLWLLIGIVTFALISLAGIAGLQGLASTLAIVGWFLLVPLFLFWGEEIADLLLETRTATAETRSPGTERAGDALEELKRRYAAGEIDDAEFERRLDRLVGVEDALEGAFSRPSTDGGGSIPAGSNADESRDREPERER